MLKSRPWVNALARTQKAPLLFGTLFLCHVLAAEDTGPPWPELIRQAQAALVHEDFAAAADLAGRALSRAEAAPRSSAAAEADLASALNALGVARLSLGEPTEAAPLIARALEIRRRLRPGPNLDLALSISNHASALLLSGQPAQARTAAAEAAAMFESLGATAGMDYGLTLNNLAVATAEQGDYVSAVPIYDHARVVLSALLPPSAPRLVRLLMSQGVAAQRAGELARASTLVEDALARARQASPGDPSTLAGALNALGDLRLHQGRPKEAEPALTEAFRLIASSAPRKALRDGIIEANLARANQRCGHLALADEHFQSALSTLREVQSTSPAEYASEMNNYGLLLVDLKRFPRAAEAFEEAQRIFESSLGPSHPSSVAVLVNLAGVADRRHQPARAAELYQRAIDLDTEHFGRNHFRVGLDLNSLGAFEARRKHLPQASKLLRESYEILRTAYGPDHPDVALVASNLGHTLAQLKQYDEAEALYANAIRIQELRFGPDYERLIPLYEEYAEVLHANQHFAASESAKVQAMRIRVRQALGKTSVAG